MARLLRDAGVPADRIVEESASTNTLSSVENCSRLISAAAPRTVTVCTDRYHAPRCRWLFRLCGILARAAPVASGRAANGTVRWSWYYLRESAAVPVDIVLLLAHHLWRA